MMLNLTLSQAVEGWILSKTVEGCSPHTLENYGRALRRFRTFLSPADPLITDLTPDHIRAFIRQLQTTLFDQPGAVRRAPVRLSAKTVRNHHTALSSLWTWAVQEDYAHEHIVRRVTPPKPEKSDINPFIEAEVRELLAAVDHSAPWTGRPGTRHTRPQQLRLRDRATILFFLDTGVRVSELINLDVADLDIKRGSARVRGKSRMNQGKGKERTVYVGKKTRKALWRYLTLRAGKTDDSPLFSKLDGGRQDRRHLGRHLRRLGQRAGVSRTYPHKFRHTFALNFVRNVPNIYALQQMMGHASMEMCRRYLALAEADVELTHRAASPVDNWRL